MGFGFRPLVDDDLPLLHGWLNEPGVVRWWEGDDVSWDAVVADYGSNPEETTEYWIAELDGEPFGWVQLWLGVDEAEYARNWWDLGVNHSCGGIDYLVGPVEGRGRGQGSAMLRAFVADVGFGRHPQLTQIGAAPNVENPASWRACEKAGLRKVGIAPDRDGPGYVLVVDRPGVPAMRTETADDHAAVEAVVAAAFGSPAEARLVADLRADPDAFVPELSVVATDDAGEVVGHVLVTRIRIDEHPALCLSPLAVHPDHQRTGVGRALVHEAVARSRVQPDAPVLVLQGNPDYYGRLGFQPSEPLGITMDLPDWAPREAAQALLLHGDVPEVRGHVLLPPAFDGL